MRATLFFSFLVYANAQFADLAKGVVLHLGSYETSYTTGNFSWRYEPLSPNDLTSSQNARILVEDLRRLFKVGFNIYPPLDPYARANLPTLSLDDYIDSIKGEVNFQNLVIAGAQQFYDNYLELRLKTGRADFEFFIPSLNFDVDIETDLVVANILPLHYSGHLSLVLRGVNITGAFQAETTPVFGRDDFFQLVALFFRLHINDVELLLNGPNDKINKFIEDCLILGIDISHDIIPPNLIAKLIYYANRNAAQVILEEANNMLLVATAKQVLAYLLP